jgi:hypothetical protein
VRGWRDPAATGGGTAELVDSKQVPRRGMLDAPRVSWLGQRVATWADRPSPPEGMGKEQEKWAWPERILNSARRMFSAVQTSKKPNHFLFLAEKNHVSKD